MNDQSLRLSRHRCFTHFAQRVAERIGDDVDPRHLWEGLRWAIAENRQDLVEFVVRLSRKRGRRLWKFRRPDQRFFFVIYDHDLDCPITVMRPEGEVKFHRGMNRRPLRLESCL